MGRLAASLICLAMSVSLVATVPDLEVGPVEAKVVSGPDEDGDLLVAIKVTVTNNSDSEQTVTLEIQALDSEDFEVFECDLSGTIGPGTTRAITDTDYINAEIYKTISQWRVED